MRRVVALLLITLAFSLQAQTWQSPLLQDHPLVGKIVDLKAARFISEQQLTAQLANAPILLIGEKHDNPDHHLIQKQLLEQLAGSNTRVVFEMLDDRHQSSLAHLETSKTLEQLHIQLNWTENKGWPWEFYGPLFYQSNINGAELFAGNIDREKIKQLYAEGTEILAGDTRFASVNRITPEVKTQIMDLVFESHCKMMPREHLQPMVTIQLAKDASMASALSGSQKAQNLLIAGNVHVRKDIGVPAHLSENIQPVVLMLMEVEQGRHELQDYTAMASQADYLWFAPQATDKDYCEDLKGKAGSSD